MIRLEDVRSLSLFDGMSDEQLSELLAAGEEVGFAPGEDVWRQGEAAESWWVLVDGALDLVRRSGREEAVVGRFDEPGNWAGGFRAWDEHGVYLATGRATSNGRMLRVPAVVLRDLVARYPLISHVIDGLFHTARDVEAGARQRDALVTLGRLSAGLAHEINNPAAAATRAVDILGSACASLLSSLRRLADGQISPTQFSALDDLRQQLSADPAPADAVALVDREEAVGDWLEEREVADGWRLASTLAGAGADVAWLSHVSDALPPDALAPGVEWVASTVSATALLGELKEATGRISELVAAVKSYSQMDRATMQRTRITDGLESTLVMFGYRLKDGVTVVRDYDPDLPDIPASAGELNQVWTNLIDNAIDAMDAAGTLTLAARLEGDQVVVEVGDTGPGMSAEVVEHAFDAFFTTKDVGKGTGLGLDIARRIVVDRHHGAVSIVSPSVPGDPPRGTTVVVRLPAQGAVR